MKKKKKKKKEKIIYPLADVFYFIFQFFFISPTFLKVVVSAITVLNRSFVPTCSVAASCPPK